MIRVNTGFQVNTALPIDLRAIADTQSDRNAIPLTWRYEGLPVYVVDDQQEYRLIGGTTDSNWTPWPITLSFALTASVVLNAASSLSSSWASSSIESSFSTQSLYATQSLFASQSISASYISASNIDGTVTSASYALSASYAPFTDNPNAVSASWASSSIQSAYATQSLYTTSSIQSIYATQSLYSTSSTSASLAQTASYIAASNVVGTVTSASYATTASDSFNVEAITTTGSFANQNFYVPFVTNESGSNQVVYTDSSMGLLYNPSTDVIFTTGVYLSGSMTASLVSCSVEAIVPMPINPYDAATKAYADSINPLAIDLYFRSASSLIFSDHRLMANLNTPISSSSTTIVTNAVSQSQYFIRFLSPSLGLTQIDPGNINISFTAYYNTGGGRQISISPELYVHTGSATEGTDIPIGSGSIVTLSGTSTSYTTTYFVSSSVALLTTYSLECRFKAATVSGTPNVSFVVEGGSPTGITVPVSPGKFFDFGWRNIDWWTDCSFVYRFVTRNFYNRLLCFGLEY